MGRGYKEPKPNYQRYALLKDAMLQVKKNNNDIALEVGVCAQMFSKYLLGQRKSQKLDRWFEENLNIDLDLLNCA